MSTEFWIDRLEKLPEIGQIVLLYSEILSCPIVGYWDEKVMDFMSIETNQPVLLVTHWTELPSKPMGRKSG